MVKQAVALLFLVGQVLYSLAVVVDINVKLSELGGEYCVRKDPEIFSQAEGFRRQN